jgi:predicted RNA-binding Zn-ribbon protein involved in translation (DUF1610 family)
MPVAMPALTFSCTACEWTHTTPDKVPDARFEGLNHFSACPRCGGAVISREATLLEITTARLAAWQRGAMRRKLR